LESLEFRCCLGDGCIVAARARISRLFFLSFFCLFWLGASVLPLGYCVVAEAECNWYLSILIYSFYKKIPVIKSIATIFTVLFLRTPCDCFWLSKIHERYLNLSCWFRKVIVLRKYVAQVTKDSKKDFYGHCPHTLACIR
jgi:hypothetical protein